MSRAKWVLCLTLMLLIWPLPLRAAQNGVAVVFVMDNSGSMLTNDPDGLRFRAAQMFIEQLRSQDEAGLISFANSAQANFPLTFLDVFARETFAAQLQGMKPTGEWTDLNAGMEAAYKQLDKAQGQGMVVLVSDGEPDPGPNFNAANQAAYMAKMWQTVSSFRARNWPVYTIALSSKTDIPVLTQIARETGGADFRAPSAATLEGIFQSILASCMDSEDFGEYVTPLKAAGFSQPNLVQLSSSLRMVTFRGVNESGGAIELRVTDPQGKIVSENTTGVNVVKGSNYYILSIEKPAAGSWQVQAKGAGMGRLNVDGQSIYELKVLRPFINGSWPMDSPLDFVVQVSKNGKPLAEEKPNLCLYYRGEEVLQLKPSGAELPAGTYSGGLDTLITTSGLHNLELRLTDANGSVLVHKKISLWGTDEPYLEVSLPQSSWIGQPLKLQAEAKYHKGRWTGGGIGVNAYLLGPGKSEEIPLRQDSANGVYTAELNLQQAGSYRVRFELQAKGQTGKFYTGDYLLTIQERPELYLMAPKLISVGMNGLVPVEVRSSANVAEDVQLSGNIGGNPVEESITLAPHYQGVINLKIPWQSGKKISGDIKAGSPNLKVVPQTLHINIYMRTCWQDLWYRYRSIIIPVLILLAIFLLVPAIGKFLYLLCSKRLKVQGILVVTDEYKSLTPRRLIFLNSYHKGRLVLGWDRQADITLGERVEGAANYPLILQAHLEQNLPRFLQGWLVLVGRTKLVLEVSSNGPGGFKYRGRGERWPVNKLKVIMQDGDEISCQGYRLLFRRNG